MARTPILNRVIKYAVKRNVLEQFVRQVDADQNKVTQSLIERYYDLFSREGNPEAFLALANGAPGRQKVVIQAQMKEKPLKFHKP